MYTFPFILWRGPSYYCIFHHCDLPCSLSLTEVWSSVEETKEVVMEEELTSGDSMPLSSSMIRDVFVWILVSWVTQHERTHISQDGPNKTKLMFVEHLSMKFYYYRIWVAKDARLYLLKPFKSK